MAVALSSIELERTIEVLSTAAQTLRLTRFERLSYRALLVSVDLAAVTFLLIILVFIFAVNGVPVDENWISILVGRLVFIVFIVSTLVGIVSLALNIPLLRKTYREGKRLKGLGLSSLSKSLWKESRRRRWMSQLREDVLIIGSVTLVGTVIVLVAHGITVIVLVAHGILEMEATRRAETIYLFCGALFLAITAGVLLAARYLRNQRERMDLAASAEELRKALQSLRRRKGPEVISVPAELLAKSAIIESAQIATERKDAVLESAAFRPNAYAIAFNHDATEQRATLGVADRVELEDLVAELSTDCARFEAQAEAIPGTKGATLRGTTKSKHIEIEYVIDHASRRIQIIALRHEGEASHGP